MYTIEDFKANLRRLVRPNKFIVRISSPVQDNKMDEEQLIFQTTSAVIPDRNFNEIALKYFGMEYKIPAGEIIQDLIINFICDEQWDVRGYFESWANLISLRKDNDNPIKTDAKELFEDTVLQVDQLSYDNKIIATYSFINAFPKTVEQIELNQDTMDTFSSFQVTFGYSYWLREDTNNPQGTMTINKNESLTLDSNTAPLVL